MIKLFNIPNYLIDTSKFSHYLHGNIVTEFENNFKEYVGADYACSINSATNAIFLSLTYNFPSWTLPIPSLLPPVVVNAIIQSRCSFVFRDDINWIGSSYTLVDCGSYKIIDSAQKVDRNQFKNEANDKDLMIFSHYPTKIVGSCDGGMVVSNNKNKIDWFKMAVMNGTTLDVPIILDCILISGCSTCFIIGLVRAPA